MSREPQPPDVQVKGPSAMVREGSSRVKTHPDAGNTISWALSDHLPKKRYRTDNNNGNGDRGFDDGLPGSRRTGEPDRSSSRIEVDGGWLLYVLTYNTQNN